VESASHSTGQGRRKAKINSALWDIEATACIAINFVFKKLGLFSFAVLSTAKEIIFNSAIFASGAKRAVKNKNH
jgi:hypothetical protein